MAIDNLSNTISKQLPFILIELVNLTLQSTLDNKEIDTQSASYVSASHNQTFLQCICFNLSIQEVDLAMVGIDQSHAQVGHQSHMSFS